MEFLRFVVGMQLKPNRRRLEHLWIVDEVHHQFSVRCHSHAILDNQNFDLIPLADAFALPQPYSFMACRINAIATISVPNSPVVAKHEKRSTKSERIVAVLNTLTERGDGRVSRRVMRRARL